MQLLSRESFFGSSSIKYSKITKESLLEQTAAHPSLPPTQHVPALLLRPFLLHTLFAEAKPSAFSRHLPSRCPLPPLNRLDSLPLLLACQNRPRVLFFFPAPLLLSNLQESLQKEKKMRLGRAVSLLCPQTLGSAESAALAATATSFHWQVFLFGRNCQTVPRVGCSKVGQLQLEGEQTAVIFFLNMARH